MGGGVWHREFQLVGLGGVGDTEYIERQDTKRTKENDMATITLDQIKETQGVKGVNVWAKGSITRHYVDVGQAVTKVWWEEDGKLRIQDGKGRDSSEAIETIERLIGCNLIDRRSKAADYVIVK